MTCRRTLSRVWGVLLPLAVAASAGAGARREVTEAEKAHLAKVWQRPIVLRVYGETCDSLGVQVGQQLMTRVRPEEAIADRCLSAFSPGCSLAELRDGLLAQFGFLLEPYSAAESVHFRIRPAAPSNGARTSRPAITASRRPATGDRRPAATPKVASHPAGSSLPAADPKLREKLDLADAEIDDEHGGLPVLLAAISEAAGVSILADHTPRAASSEIPAREFLNRLHGRTLAEALDLTASAFSYRWSRAGRWFLFKAAR